MTTPTLQSQTLNVGSGSWNVPANVTSVLVTMIAGGGAGSSSTATGGGGGASGEYCEQVPLKVTAGGTVSYTCGAKGAKAAAGNNPGGSGADSIFGPIQCKGGSGGGIGARQNGGDGGGKNGGLHGQAQLVGTADGLCHWGGSAGGLGKTSSAGNGSPGGDAPFANIAGALGGTSATLLCGGGGASTQFGVGGAGGGDAQANGFDAASTSYGAGGGGAASGTHQGGDGADGVIIVYWVGP